MFVLVLDMLASLSIVASIPVLTLVDDLRLALCLLGTGIAVHIVLRWYFSFDFASKPASKSVHFFVFFLRIVYIRNDVTDVEVFRFSKNKSDYYNYFHNNEIGPELGRKISLFIKGSLNEEFNFSICRCSFDKVSSNSRVAQYFVNEEEQKVHVFIHPDTLLIHLCALILLNKSELRKPKKIIDHVDYIHKEYTGVLKDSIVYYDKNELSFVSAFSMAARSSFR